MNRTSGFTLIELLIYFSLIGVFLFVLVTMAIDFAKFRDSGRERQELIENATFIDSKLSHELFQVKNSQITVPAGGATGSSLTITGSNGTVTLDTANSRLQILRQPQSQSVPLINSHVSVTNFSVTRSTINQIPAITISYTLTNRVTSGQTFQTVYYPINL